MGHRRLLLLGLAAVLAVLGVAVSVWLLPRSAINRENYRKIRDGMSLAQVEAILGGPERDESIGVHAGLLTQDGSEISKGWERERRRDFDVAVFGSAPPPAKRWTSDTVIICVGLDTEGRVWYRDAVHLRRLPECPVRMLQRRLFH